MDDKQLKRTPLQLFSLLLLQTGITIGLFLLGVKFFPQVFPLVMFFCGLYLLTTLVGKTVRLVGGKWLGTSSEDKDDDQSD
jgi:hypothetical protein